MNMKKLALAASVSAAIGAGAVGQAQASTYAGASLNVENLLILVGGVNPGAVTDFNFNIQSTATLTPGGGTLTFGTCQGLPTGVGAGNNCGGAKDISGGTNVLYAGAAEVTNIGGGHGNENYTLSDISGNREYSRADAAIIDATLVEGGATHISNVAESELLTTAINGSGTSNIDSTTDFNFTFTVAGPGTLAISFDADPELITEINDATGASASASITASMKFSQDGTNNSIEWVPSAVTAGLDPGCAVGNVTTTGVGISCVSQTVAEDLNASSNVGTIDRDTFSDALGLQAYTFTASFAAAGTYSLFITETKAVTTTRTISVPEPGSLALFGLGMATFGFVARRKQQKKA